MKTYHDYSELTDKIHAPEELKARVLQASLQQARFRQRGKTGRYSRGWSFAQKAAVAAILAVTIPLAGYAAVRGLGLTEWLSERGMEDVQAVQELVTDSVVLSDGQESVQCGEYAQFSIQEAICDSQTIYLAAKATPVDDSWFLLPQYITEEDSVQNLGIPGLTEGTVGEYIASQGKRAAYASIGYFYGEKTQESAYGEYHLDGAEDFRYGEDGALYYYYTAANTLGGGSMTLCVMGTSYTAGMQTPDRIAFDITMFDKSHTTNTVYTTVDEKVAAETGIHVQSLDIAKTEMGMYATFVFTLDDTASPHVSFRLLDENGKELTHMPMIAGIGTQDKGDGTYSTTLYYQCTADSDAAQFAIKDLNTDQVYGPYSFSE